MDMENNENRLVPGQGRPLNLEKLKKLSYGKPLAAGQPLAAAQPAASPMRPRRFRRAGSAWAGALAMGAVLAAVTTLVLLDRGGALRSLVRGSAAPALPDASLSPEDKERFWALAEYEPTRFASLMGVDQDEPARMEENARKLERLLSERSLRQ